MTHDPIRRDAVLSDCGTYRYLLTRRWGADVVVCAWGAHGVHLSPVPALVAEADRWCLGVTKSGAPKHPLYLRADAPLTPWPMEAP